MAGARTIPIHRISSAALDNKGAHNQSHASVPQADALLAQADGMSDQSARIPLYQLAEQLLVNQAAAIPLYQSLQTYAVRSRVVSWSIASTGCDAAIRVAIGVHQALAPHVRPSPQEPACRASASRDAASRPAQPPAGEPRSPTRVSPSSYRPGRSFQRSRADTRRCSRLEPESTRSTTLIRLAVAFIIPGAILMRGPGTPVMRSARCSAPTRSQRSPAMI